MSDDDGDNVYEVTTVSGAAFFEYRYCNGDPYPGGVQDDSVAEVGDFKPVDADKATPSANSTGPTCVGEKPRCSAPTVTRLPRL